MERLREECMLVFAASPFTRFSFAAASSACSFFNNKKAEWQRVTPLRGLCERANGKQGEQTGAGNGHVGSGGLAAMRSPRAFRRQAASEATKQLLRLPLLTGRR